MCGRKKEEKKGEGRKEEKGAKKYKKESGREREMREGRKGQRKKKIKEMFYLVFRLIVATVVILRGSFT